MGYTIRVRHGRSPGLVESRGKAGTRGKCLERGSVRRGFEEGIGQRRIVFDVRDLLQAHEVPIDRRASLSLQHEKRFLVDPHRLRSIAVWVARGAGRRSERYDVDGPAGYLGLSCELACENGANAPTSARRSAAPRGQPLVLPAYGSFTKAVPSMRISVPVPGSQMERPELS